MTLDGLFVLGISVLAAAAIPEYAGLAAGSALALLCGASRNAPSANLHVAAPLGSWVAVPQRASYRVGAWFKEFRTLG